MVARVVPTAANADPSISAYAVTPSDTTDLVAGPCRGLYIGGAGNVSIQVPQMNGLSAAVTLTGLLVGTVYPIGCSRVNATSTTATNIVALY